MTTSGNTTLTQNFIGARGLEAMTTKVGNNTPTTSYPLYDVHGNMVATVQKNGFGTSWTIQDERSYDVWGSVRSGNATGGPRGRYCANLGHVQDDESGLVYMRARYYEPSSGRFVSEDPAMDGANWYVYAANDPIKYADRTGRSPILVAGAIILGTIAFGAGYAFSRELAMSALKRLAAEVEHTDGYEQGQYLRDQIDVLTELHASEFREVMKAGILAVVPLQAGVACGVTSTSVGLVIAVGLVTGFICGFFATVFEACLYDYTYVQTMKYP